MLKTFTGSETYIIKGRENGSISFGMILETYTFIREDAIPKIEAEGYKVIEEEFEVMTNFERFNVEKLPDNRFKIQWDYKVNAEVVE
jgi:hypothetical protein